MRYNLMVGLLVLGWMTPAWALTTAQREKARSKANAVMGKCSEIIQWANYVDQAEREGWEHKYTPISGESITKTYDDIAQTKLHGRYDALKADLKTLVEALP